MTVAAVPGVSADVVYRIGSIEIDPVRILALDGDGRLVPLRMGCFRTLLALAAAWPAVVSKEQLARIVRGRRSLAPGDNRIHMDVAGVRGILPPGSVRSVHSVGWVLAGPVVAVPRPGRAGD